MAEDPAPLFVRTEDMSSSSGWPARYPIFQPPNAPMLVSQGLRVVAALTDGRARTAARGGYSAALAVWAWGELAHGANGVRRTLGAIALGSVAAHAIGRR